MGLGPSPNILGPSEGTNEEAMRVLGRRWFSVDYKSFELKEEGEGRKTQVIITERRGGRSFWIRFGKEGTNILFKGVESFRKEAGKNNTGLEWKENGRRYRLELRKNEGGRFLLCSVVDLDGRWHRLSFPEGKGLLNGWSMLEEALLAMGTMENSGEKSKPTKPSILGKAETKETKEKGQSKLQSSGKTKTHGRGNQDMIWMDISKFISKEFLGSLKHGVVGGWKSKQASDPPLNDLAAWAKRAWRLKGDVNFQKLSQKLFLMGFESVEEAEWVMENGSRIFRGEAMSLEWWSPSIGCEGRKEQESEVWIRVVGLPLHLWSEEILKELGDKCGGFVVMDKATIHRKDLRWARILVKNSCSRKPSSVNILARARSYELQIWWEIQPKLVDVYPKVYRPKGLLTRSSEEDDEIARADECVRSTIGKRLHTAQELQWEERQQKGKALSGSDSGVIKRLKCAGIPRVGSKICRVSQNNLGIRETNVGDTNEREWASKIRQLGLQSENKEAQKLFPRKEFGMGHCPKSHREQYSSGRVSGLQYGAGSGQSPSGHHGAYVGQSPCNKRRVVRSIVSPRLKDKEIENVGMSGDEARDTERLNFAKLPDSVTAGIEEEGGQKKRQSANLGQTKDNTTKGDTSSKARRTSREERDSPTEGKVGSSHESDWDLNSGKATSDVFLTAASNTEGDEGVSCGGEKSLEPISISAGGYERYISEMGKEIGACRNPTCREDRTPVSKREAEGDDISQAEKTVDTEAESLGKLDGTWSMPACKARRNSPVRQERERIGSGPASFLERGPATCEGSDPEAGRVQGLELGLGRPNCMDLGPSPNINCYPYVLGSDGFICSKAMEKGAVLSKEVQSGPPLQSSHRCSCFLGIEEKVIHNWEAVENREDHSQGNESLKINRYDDNPYVQSTSAIISVFGRPLLSGDTSGLGVSNETDDLEPLRVVEADGREWGVDFSEVPDEDGGRLEVVCQKMIESQNEVSDLWNYESWEKSCLAKFSNFLGFPTKGFEEEITKLLRNLVNAQKLGKGKECLTVSKSERELRKLKWTINYNGSKNSREGGRDRGNLLLKLK